MAQLLLALPASVMFLAEISMECPYLRIMKTPGFYDESGSHRECRVMSRGARSVIFRPCIRCGIVLLPAFRQQLQLGAR